MISQASVQQVLNKADIVEIVGQFVKLRRRGGNYIANCPFHNEKTPSFSIHAAKGIYKCFGCGKGGDVVSFVKEYEKFSFTEAIRWLAKYYHIALDETIPSEEFIAQQQIEESLRVINNFATDYFENILHNNEEGRIVGYGYFKERGFRDSIIKDFRLGYCLDDWEAFTQHALAKGYNLELLQKAGLSKVSAAGKAYDNYRGRVVFPIFSSTGQIIGFGARILKKDEKAPKYVNTPENELYIKNKVLYGLYQARQSIGKLNECILVEGYTDVISLHQSGIQNVVSSSGTSLTEGQLKLIGQMTKNLTILYDGDAAGINAALRGLDLALADSFNVQLVLLPEGEDPDSFVQTKGTSYFKEYLNANKKDMIGFRLELGIQASAGDPVKKAKLVNEIAETIAKINKAEDFTLQQHYIRQSSMLLKIEEEGLVNLVNKYIRENAQKQLRLQERQATSEQITQEKAGISSDFEQEKPQDEASWIAKDYKEEWQLVKILLEYGGKPYKDANCVAEAILEIIDIDSMESEHVRTIIQACEHIYYKQKRIPEIQDFIRHEHAYIREKLAGLLQEKYTPSENWKKVIKIEVQFGEELYDKEVESSLAYFELKMLQKLLLQNLEQMKTVTDSETLMPLMYAHQKLKEREKELMAIVIVH